MVRHFSLAIFRDFKPVISLVRTIRLMRIQHTMNKLQQFDYIICKYCCVFLTFIITFQSTFYELWEGRGGDLIWLNY